jgi:8-oxo-dGTP pyrophosphatase MutT (NUDIX family)
MGMLEGKIRPLALAIIKKDNYFLACPGHDDQKNEDFFRLIGGGVDFGENSLVALKREIDEELGAELVDCKLLSVLENVFSYNGQAGHEICFIYEASFKDQSNYQKESFQILDKKQGVLAVWVEMTKENLKRTYPQGAIKMAIKMD